jgi:ribonuclease J
MPNRKDRLRVIPLGGLDEIGKNMTVFEYGDDMILVDAGIMFPDVEMPGIDLVLPDYSYVLQRSDRLRGIIITHGHEDHTGTLPYLLRDLGTTVPILGTKLTLGLVKGKLEEFRLTKTRLREVKPGMHISLGSFGFDFMAVNHSIPDGVAVLIRTPVGNVLHTGDFKFDQTASCCSCRTRPERSTSATRTPRPRSGAPCTRSSPRRHSA